MELIDCTFRDGGYHTDWHFELGLVNEYLRVSKESGISNIEIGFRSPIVHNTSGAHAFTSERYLSTLIIPNDINLGVMINAKEFIDLGKADFKLLRKIFPDQPSQINFVRIAADLEDLENSLALRHELIKIGFDVQINLMKASRLERLDLELLNYLDKFISKSDLKILTLADTYGSLTPESTSEIVKAIKNISDVAIGVHMHDNMGLAFTNTVAALSSGAEYVDSTMSGMGRGPGNLRTEFLQTIFTDSAIDFDRLLAFTAQSFEALKNRYSWGANSLYFIAAVNNIHPTYVQELCSGTQYNAEKVLEALEKLATLNSSSFSSEILNSMWATPASKRAPVKSNSKTLAAGWCENADIVLVGSGVSLYALGGSLNTAIRQSGTSFKVVSVNLQPQIDKSLMDYFIIVDRLKYVIDSANDVALSSVISPEDFAEDGSTLIFNPNSSKESNLEVETVSWPTHGYNTLYYALSALSYGRARRIYLVGFDGYPDDPKRQQQNQEVLDLFSTNQECAIFISTPSNYRGNRCSIFSII